VHTQKQRNALSCDTTVVCAVTEKTDTARKRIAKLAMSVKAETASRVICRYVLVYRGD
jgi:hypothetical protein